MIIRTHRNCPTIEIDSPKTYIESASVIIIRNVPKIPAPEVKKYMT